MYDSVSSPATQSLALRLAPKGGALIVTSPLTIKTEDAEKAGVSLYRTLGILRSEPNLELLEKVYHDSVAGWLETGVIKVRPLRSIVPPQIAHHDFQPNRVEIVPGGLAGIPEALKRFEGDQVSGRKLIARPEETP